jgi:hypothetical protein
LAFAGAFLAFLGAGLRVAFFAIRGLQSAWSVRDAALDQTTVSDG